MKQNTRRINLKKVNKEDMKFIYELMTNKLVRERLFEQREFSYEEHLKYWQTFHGFAYIIIHNEKKIGLLRDETQELSIQILPEYWNMGIGSKVISDYCDGKQGFHARIKNNNIASVKIFEKAGFKHHHIVLKK